MLDLGEIIEIRGEKCTVCYETEYQNERFICIAFERDKVIYDIYKYKIVDNNLKVAHVDDQETLNGVIAIFLEQGFDTVDSLKEIEN